MTLNDIRARAEAASEGPWFAVRYYVGSGQDQGDPDAEIATTGYKPDAEFIAHARTDIPRLLAALDAVQGLHGDDEGFCDHCGGRTDFVDYPCPTVRAITAALDGGAG